jgi:CheY-like chemotaxis protein
MNTHEKTGQKCSFFGMTLRVILVIIWTPSGLRMNRVQVSRVASVSVASSSIILLIDDEQMVRDLLIRVLAPSFPAYTFATAKDAIEGIALVQHYADQLRLIILDIQLPRLDGRVAATVLRELAPRVPVMPFSRHDDMFPILLELGCVEPVLKRPHAMRQMPQRVARALRAEVPPLSSAEWIGMAQAQVRLTLGEAADSPNAAEGDDGMVHLPRADVNRVRALLDQYVQRFASPAREIVQARRVLAEKAKNDDAP